MPDFKLENKCTNWVIRTQICCFTHYNLLNNISSFATLPIQISAPAQQLYFLALSVLNVISRPFY